MFSSAGLFVSVMHRLACACGAARDAMKYFTNKW